MGVMAAPPDSEPPLRRAPADSAPESGSVPARPAFAHPQWLVGIVLILGAMAVVAGLSEPVWLLIGAPCIAVLVLYVWVRIRHNGDRNPD